VGKAVVAGLLWIAAYSPYEQDSAVIVNSGSTNISGFRIVVKRSGEAEYTDTRSGKTGAHTISEATARRFYEDLEAAKPFSSLPRPRCAKSASFGSVLTIEWGGERTPDLSCGDGNDEKLRTLIKDTEGIVKLFQEK
jgi:hypothetical protein